jgi:riboflavin kinase/FMN adenylyltransferase
VYFARAAVIEPPRKAESHMDVFPDRGRPFPAVVNIGTRPTFDSGSSSQLLEAHLLDFDEQIYGKLLEVELLARHRDEMRFKGPEELIAQIQKDIEGKSAVLGRAPAAARSGEKSSGKAPR